MIDPPSSRIFDMTMSHSLSVADGTEATRFFLVPPSERAKWQCSSRVLPQMIPQSHQPTPITKAINPKASPGSGFTRLAPNRPSSRRGWGSRPKSRCGRVEHAERAPSQHRCFLLTVRLSRPDRNRPRPRCRRGRTRSRCHPAVAGRIQAWSCRTRRPERSRSSGRVRRR
jgi:hypothetical protein